MPGTSRSLPAVPHSHHSHLSPAGASGAMTISSLQSHNHFLIALWLGCTCKSELIYGCVSMHRGVCAVRVEACAHVCAVCVCVCAYAGADVAVALILPLNCLPGRELSGAWGCFPTPFLTGATPEDISLDLGGSPRRRGNPLCQISFLPSAAPGQVLPRTKPRLPSCPVWDSQCLIWWHLLGDPLLPQSPIL